MAIAFEKGLEVAQAFQQLMLDITTANDAFNINIRNVSLFDIGKYEKWLDDNAKLPCALILGEGSFVPAASGEIEAIKNLAVIVSYQPDSQDNSVYTDYSKLGAAIQKQIANNPCLGKNWVTEMFIIDNVDPLINDKRQSYAFQFTVKIDYFFDSDTP